MNKNSTNHQANHFDNLKDSFDLRRMKNLKKTNFTLQPKSGSIHSRSANLILPYDSSVVNLPENLLFDPIDVDTFLIDPEQFYYEDPFAGKGIPYTLSINPLLGEYIVPIKNILQNIFKPLISFYVWDCYIT